MAYRFIELCQIFEEEHTKKKWNRLENGKCSHAKTREIRNIRDFLNIFSICFYTNMYNITFISIVFQIQICVYKT